MKKKRLALSGPFLVVGYSFPSAHSMTVLIFYGMIIYKL